MPVGLARTALGDRRLGLDKDAEDGLAPFDDLADAETKGDAVGVVLEVVDPNGGRAQIQTLPELIEGERLEGPDIDVGAVVAAGEAGLSLIVSVTPLQG
jgi:hypothetical protein